MKRRDIIFSSVDNIKLGTTDGGFQTRYLPPQPMLPSLKDGVMIKWTGVHPNSSTDMQLHVVQLPSLNTGTGLKQWRLIQRDLNIKDYAIEPACNLLVILGYTGPLVNEPLSNHWDDPRQPGPFRTERVSDQPLLYYFRTLSANQPHPMALHPVLDCGLRVSSAREYMMRCLGDLIVARTPYLGGGHRGHGLIIYNWVTGALLVR